MKPYGLILAGGGAKGAYQIGAWKAMRELDIEFEAIAGASIGAINGAMIAQGDFDDAYELWSNVEVSSGVNIQGELKDPKICSASVISRNRTRDNTQRRC